MAATLNYVIHNGAAREIAARPPQSLHDRPDGARTSQPLHQLVRDVPGVERREHQHVRASRRPGCPAPSGQPPPTGERSVSLQFSVHGEVEAHAPGLRRRAARTRSTDRARRAPARAERKKATNGSSPTMRRRSAAAAMAMSASCVARRIANDRAVGEGQHLGLAAAKRRNAPCRTRSRPSARRRAGPTIQSAARSTSPVVWTAPATQPSAWPVGDERVGEEQRRVEKLDRLALL